MDVLARAISSALFLSHGVREDTTITLHLMGGPGVPRRIRFNGAKVKGLHVDERAIAGRIRSIISDRVLSVGIGLNMDLALNIQVET